MGGAVEESGWECYDVSSFLLLKCRGGRVAARGTMGGKEKNSGDREERLM
jgi:hypothetical protein